MGVDWYNSIAIRNGGYKNNSIFTIEGISAETIYEQELVKLISLHGSVLDAGCGHGDFTIKMARYAKSIIGFDNSNEMINIANVLLKEVRINNLQFVFASTKEELPFLDGEFDLIYDRRGPTSIINHSRILRSGGTIFGIHSGALELVMERLTNNNFIDIEITEYKDAKICFPNEIEFSKFIAGIPGNPDYTASEHKDELAMKIKEHTVNGRLEIEEYKYIWKAKKT